MSENNKKYYVYWIISGQSNYIGATVDPVKRLRQHCGLTVGGARRTKGKLWTYKCVISGFRTWSEALQLEWAIKYYSKRCRGIYSRKAALEKVLSMDKWTSNAPLSSELTLKVEFDPCEFGFPPDKLPSPKIKKPITKLYGSQSRDKKWKKNLYGVRY